jgi:hypothetical protein
MDRQPAETSATKVPRLSSMQDRERDKTTAEKHSFETLSNSSQIRFRTPDFVNS